MLKLYFLNWKQNIYVETDNIKQVNRPANDVKKKTK